MWRYPVGDGANRVMTLVMKTSKLKMAVGGRGVIMQAGISKGYDSAWLDE